MCVCVSRSSVLLDIRKLMFPGVLFRVLGLGFHFFKVSLGGFVTASGFFLAWFRVSLLSPFI